MLAYVFWHWKRPEASAAAYETRLRDFHAALAAAPPAGFVRSQVFALHGAPWDGAPWDGAPVTGGDGYEDWYLLEHSAALDALNDAAVSGVRRQPHDASAAMAAGGTAGLYGLRLGTPPDAVRTACWFAQTPGARYGEFLERIAPIVASSAGALWMRRMTLGPAPEFCLHAPSRVALPPDVDAREIGVRAVFPHRA